MHTPESYVIVDASRRRQIVFHSFLIQDFPLHIVRLSIMPIATLDPRNGTDAAFNAEDAASQNLQPSPAKRHEEHQYLDLIRRILEDGEHRPDRY